MKKINAIARLCKLFLNKKFTDLEDIANSYNSVSKNYEEILKHYYQNINIEKISV